MRWSIIRVIWLRELRDQLRDRRTIFMIVVLPILLYPVLGIGMLTFYQGLLRRELKNSVGIYGSEYLPSAETTEVTSITQVSCCAFTPIATPLTAVSLAAATEIVRGQAYPPLLVASDGKQRFHAILFDRPEEADALQVTLLPASTSPDPEIDSTPLESKEVDLLMVIPPDFQAQLREGRNAIVLRFREGDEHSRLAALRVTDILNRWKKQLKAIRFLRQGLPADFDEPFKVSEKNQFGEDPKQTAPGMFDLFARLFPIVLVMWSLAGALYPAVDLCAGEKERGTMETLLISPASREEIVWGKFLTIWVFSAATALLNLASIAITTWPFSSHLASEAARPAALLWCVVLVLPMSALFSALCLSIGAYARSSKEGQYYLMPLFFGTIPLILLTMLPNVELNPFYSLIPVTGVALLLQELMTATRAKPIPWGYFIAVLAPVALSSWLALRWAIEQFKREEVLFREAERLDVGLWIRRLFREKEATPSAGQALFCFGLIIAMRWLTFGFGERLALPVRIGIGYLAFVAAPPLFMALLLTTRPRQGLMLRLPSLRSFLVAMLLAVLLLPPLSGMTLFILERFSPVVKQLLTERNPLTEELRALARGQATGSAWWQFGLVLTLLPAVCEEVAFRGFILNGLRRRFRPWTAILLSSFLFALSHMNVFQFLPALCLGVVLGVLALRTGSILPGIGFHLLHNGLVIGAVWFQAWLEQQGYRMEDIPSAQLGWLIVSGLCLLLAIPLFWRLSAFGYHRWAGEDAPLLAKPWGITDEVPGGSSVAEELRS